MMSEKTAKDDVKANGVTSPVVVDVVEPDDETLRCGYWSWKPDCLQVCNTPRWLLVCISWFTFTQGFVVNGIIYVNLSPWERLYELQSSQTAWIASTYDISAGACDGYFYIQINSILLLLL